MNNVPAQTRLLRAACVVALGLTLAGCATHTPEPGVSRTLDIRYGPYPCDIDLDTLVTEPPCAAFLASAQRLTIDIDGVGEHHGKTGSTDLTVAVEPAGSPEIMRLAIDFRYALNDGLREMTTHLSTPYGRWIAVSAAHDEQIRDGHRYPQADAVFLRMTRADD